MITYDLMLDRQRLIGADKFSVAANANETLSLRFHFDRHWRRFDSKAAVFKNSDGEYYIIEIKENRAQVPWEVLKKEGLFQLSVIGYEQEKVISSEMIEIEVEESLLPEDYKTFSPSEVLFDRFKRECIEQAYLDYEDEIRELKKAHIEELLRIGQSVNEFTLNYEAQLKEKDETIKQMELSHDADITDFRNQISEKDTQIDYYKEKADKWDLVDYAIGIKTSTTQALWTGSNQSFALPMLNTRSITAFNPGSFGQSLKAIGLDLTSVSSFEAMFASHQAIEKLELRSTQKITSFARLLEGCKTIKNLSIDNMDNCGILTRMFCEAINLLSVSFGTEVQAGDYDRCFYNCRALKEINGCFNMDYATDVDSMFAGCFSLEKVTFKEETIRKSIDFSSCLNLTKESMINIFYALSSENSGTVSFSITAFENNFDAREREVWVDYITNTKSWVLTLE